MQRNTLEETLFDAAETQLNPEKNVKRVCKCDKNDNKTEELEYDSVNILIADRKYTYEF